MGDDDDRAAAYSYDDGVDNFATANNSNGIGDCGDAGVVDYDDYGDYDHQHQGDVDHVIDDDGEEG